MQTNEVPTSAPGDCAPTCSEEPAPIKMTNQQLDTPVHDGHCTLSSVTTLGPLCTKNCAPDKGNATPVHPYPVVPPDTRVLKPVSRNPVSRIPV